MILTHKIALKILNIILMLARAMGHIYTRAEPTKQSTE